MKTFIPDYYDGFSCLMGECRHTCCKGWEIDIDSDTLAYYKSLRRPRRKSILRGIDETADGASFRLTEDERCPFLNKDGLCDIVILLGKGGLCDICRDHPLYRNYISDREETGLGLCCESACRLILGRETPISLVLTADDGNDKPDEESEAVIAERDALVSIAQDRSLPVAERVMKIENRASVSAPDIRALTEEMKTLEILDCGWLRQLDAASESTGEAVFCAEEELRFENLLSYLLFRHIPEADGKENVPPLVSFCTASWRLIRSIYLHGEHSAEALEEICRMWSAEIEYSDENPAAVLNMLNGNAV